MQIRFFATIRECTGESEIRWNEPTATLGELLRALSARYGFDTPGLDGPAVIEAIARRRGCHVRGGGFDLEKAALILLRDYRSGALGRISLETPQSREEMLRNESTETTREPDPAE